MVDDRIFDADIESSSSFRCISSVSETLTSSVFVPPIYNTTTILPFEYSSANPKSEEGDHMFLLKDSEHADAMLSKREPNSVGASVVRMIARVMGDPMQCALISATS